MGITRIVKMMRSIAVSLLLFMGILGFLPVYSCAEVSLELCKDHINIDFNYHGEKLFMKGIVDKGSDLVIKVVSIDQHSQVLRKKEHVAGLVWMNVGEITFSNVPEFYEVRATRALDEILTPEEKARYGLGYQALFLQSSLAQNGVKLEGAEKEKWFEEFIKYKESSRLYSAGTGPSAGSKKAHAAFSLGVSEANASGSPLPISGGQGRTTDYSFVFEWPYQAKPGTYKATVYEVRDKKVVGQAEDTFVVKKVGAVNVLSGLLNKHGAIYGIISILVALGAGFGVGAVFGKGGGAH